MHVGETIRALRESSGMTQKQLAEKTGISRGAVMQFELGYKLPSLPTLNMLAIALGTTPAALLEGSGDTKEARM